jgi:hypothetical protein
VPSKLLPNGIENHFPLLGKAAKNQHDFGSDRVDSLANLLVVKKQVDELSDLDLVDGYSRIAIDLTKFLPNRACPAKAKWSWRRDDRLSSEDGKKPRRDR